MITAGYDSTTGVSIVLLGAGIVNTLEISQVQCLLNLSLWDDWIREFKMNIKINGKDIEIDEEDYLLNFDDSDA